MSTHTHLSLLTEILTLVFLHRLIRSSPVQHFNRQRGGESLPALHG